MVVWYILCRQPCRGHMIANPSSWTLLGTVYPARFVAFIPGFGGCRTYGLMKPCGCCRSVNLALSSSSFRDCRIHGMVRCICIVALVAEYSPACIALKASGCAICLRRRILFWIVSLSIAVVVGIKPVDPPFEIISRANLVDGALVLLMVCLPTFFGGSVLIRHFAMRVDTLRVCWSVGGARGSRDGLYGWSVLGGVNAWVRISKRIPSSIHCIPC